jgi:hypothetical protein
MVWLLGTPLGCSSGIDTYFGKPWMDTVYNGEIRKKKCGDLSKFADPLDINIYIYIHINIHKYIHINISEI